MRLKWASNSIQELRANHPCYVDEGTPLQFVLVCCDDDGSEWALTFEGSEVFRGPLKLAIEAAERQGRDDKLTERINALREECHRLDKIQGGNWRRLKTLNARRDQLSRLIRQQGRA